MSARSRADSAWAAEARQVPSERSARVITAEDLPGDDPSLDFVSALVNLADLRVPVDRLDRSFEVVVPALCGEPEPTVRLGREVETD